MLFREQFARMSVTNLLLSSLRFSEKRFRKTNYLWCLRRNGYFYNLILLLKVTDSTPNGITEHTAKSDISAVVMRSSCQPEDVLDKLLFLFAAAVGTIVFSISAIYNRPFRCKVLLREHSLSSLKDLLEITDSNDDTINTTQNTKRSLQNSFT